MHNLPSLQVHVWSASQNSVPISYMRSDLSLHCLLSGLITGKISEKRHCHGKFPKQRSSNEIGHWTWLQKVLLLQKSLVSIPWHEISPLHNLCPSMHSERHSTSPLVEMCDVSITIEHRHVHAPLRSPSNSMVKNSIIDGRIKRILAMVMAWYVKFWTLLPCCISPLKGLLRAFPACCTIHITIESPSTIEFSLYLIIDHSDVDVEPPSHISNL